jgi:hypothetical protein
VVGLRDQINQKPAIAAGVVGGIILLLIGLMIFHFRSGNASAISGAQSYYTIDDGKTWFADAWEKVPPFDYDGGQAVRCYLFKTASSGPFVGYLECYSQKVHDNLTGTVKSPIPVDIVGGTLVKRPGEKNWVSQVSAAGQKIMNVKAPNGSAEPVEPVSP